jgi:hypothetical protein
MQRREGMSKMTMRSNNRISAPAAAGRLFTCTTRVRQLEFWQVWRTHHGSSAQKSECDRFITLMEESTYRLRL